ncbi:predicted protein [Histoplasma capsulatum H143]|uniref:Uncharacterized protein n=1 Tax=Ajellomyces capsulatus (strain H143) TaxID=544712 RepID=C6H657_AJECH|nr:predicted protein [Histoplasma capsulatum H143]
MREAIKKAVAWQLADMVPIFVVGQQDKAPGERGFRICLAMSWTADSGWDGYERTLRTGQSEKYPTGLEDCEYQFLACLLSFQRMRSPKPRSLRGHEFELGWFRRNNVQETDLESPPQLIIDPVW